MTEPQQRVIIAGKINGKSEGEIVNGSYEMKILGFKKLNNYTRYKFKITFSDHRIRKSNQS